jgi:predicted RNA binding protein YcfA (HicA-like mRNA interferase family)
LRVLSGREICKILVEHGFEKMRQKGSHIIMQKKRVTTQGKGVTKSGKKGASVNARRKAARAFTSFFRAVER